MECEKRWKEDKAIKEEILKEELNRHDFKLKQLSLFFIEMNIITPNFIQGDILTKIVFVLPTLYPILSIYHRKNLRYKKPGVLLKFS